LRLLLAAIAVGAAAAAGCGSPPPPLARDLPSPGERHVAVAMQPTIARSVDWSAPGFCGRVCAPALRPGERVERCGRLRLQPHLANDLGPSSEAVLCMLR
jgi:hypothetical protein